MLGIDETTWCRSYSFPTTGGESLVDTAKDFYDSLSRRCFVDQRSSSEKKKFSAPLSQSSARRSGKPSLHSRPAAVGLRMLRRSCVRKSLIGRLRKNSEVTTELMRQWRRRRRRQRRLFTFESAQIIYLRTKLAKQQQQGRQRRRRGLLVLQRLIFT